MNEIYELSEHEVSILHALLGHAVNAGVPVKVAMDGGLKVKTPSMWTAPFGHRVDGNGDPI